MYGKSGDIVRLQHIFSAISEIEKYKASRNFNDFLNDSMFRFACIKQLEVIGEASNRISKETQQKFSSIEWAQLIGMRNIFVHEYFGIDVNIAWDIIENDLPELKTKIKDILKVLSIEPE